MKLKNNYYYFISDLNELDSFFDKTQNLLRNKLTYCLAYTVYTPKLKCVNINQALDYSGQSYKKIFKRNNNFDCLYGNQLAYLTNKSDYERYARLLEQGIILELTDNDKIVDKWNEIKHIKDVESIKMLLQMYCQDI